MPDWRIEAIGGKPVPVDIRPRVLSTAIDMEDPTASIDLALGTADYYGLTQDDARNIALQVARSVATSQSPSETASSSLGLDQGTVDTEVLVGTTAWPSAPAPRLR